MSDNRLDNEREHGKKISSHAEDVWNWSSPAGQVRANRRAELMILTAKIAKEDQALEIGCGTGLFTGKVQQATGAEITAIDISQDLLDQAKEKYRDVNFKIDDAMSLSFEDQSFSVVYGSSVLHHLDMMKAMQEIYRVLKPGGRIVFAEPNMLNPQIFVQKNVPVIKRMLGDSPDETAVVRWSFNNMLKETGYVNTKVFPYDFLHPITPKPLVGVVNSIGKLVEKLPVLKEIAGSVIIYGEKKK
ncbi:MAG TPA: class I SAM-dependent methyltransferase [Bacteroidia bacterium]|nr:class I SAM-dependent methyltransferase [Bacteroidia bacterium]